MKAVRIEAPIQGALGNEVNVGDTVMVVSTGWGNTYVRKGKYLGYINGSGYYKQRAQIEIESKRHIRVKPDGTEFNWTTEYDRNTWPEVSKTLVYKEVPYTYVTTLNLNRIATLSK